MSGKVRLFVAFVFSFVLALVPAWHAARAEDVPPEVQQAAANDDASGAREVQMAAASSDFPEHPPLIGQFTVGPILGEKGASLTYRFRLDSNPVGPLWLTARVRMTGAVDKADLTAGIVLHRFYGLGSESFNQKVGETRNKIYARTYSTEAMERNVLVLATGARGSLVTTFDPGHDSNFLPDHAAMHYEAEAGLQYHNDSSLGAHRVYEAYALYSHAGAGGVAAVHSSFGFLPWLALGLEYGYVPIADNVRNSYFTIEAGVSWGH